MQLTCPHCGSVIERTALDVQFCPNCGRRIEPGETGPAAPLPGAPEPGGPPSTGLPPPGAIPGPRAGALPGTPTPPPWERRRELGLFTAWWETWKAVLFSPGRFWEGVPPHGSFGDALLFGWSATAVGYLISLPLTVLSLYAQRPMIERMLVQMQYPPELQALVLRFMSGSFITYLMLGGLLLFPIGFIIQTAILHLFALMFGAAKNGFTATARVVGYAYAPQALVWVPCVGALAIFYVVAQQIMGLPRVQQTTTGRAVGTALAPWVLGMCCTCVGFGLLAFAGAMAGAAGSQ